MADEYDDQAMRLLPCTNFLTRICDSRHEEECASCYNRPAIAAALRAAGREIAAPKAKLAALPTMEVNPMADKYDEQAEPLLPCDKLIVANGIKRLCPCNYRSAVAAALREAGKREEKLREDLNGISAELGLPPGIGPAEGWLKTQLENYKIALMERDDLRREVERLKNLIGIIQRESLNDLDLISKFNAEIAALKAEVDRLRNALQIIAKGDSNVDTGTIGLLQSYQMRSIAAAALEAK